MLRIVLTRSKSAILLLAIFFIIGANAVAQPSQRTEDPLEDKKLAFEEETEARRLNLEKFKAVLTASSIALPLIFGLYSINKQIKTAFVLKQVEARNSFELKTAELLLNSKTPGQLHAKARTLLKLFPKCPLPADFGSSVESFDPDEFAGPSIEWKIELFKVLVAHEAQKDLAIKVWKQLFPGDKWIDRLAEPSGSPARSNAITGESTID